jgi:hypothetical protein
MQSNLKRYFWDSPIESFSEEYRLRRIIEYASFPDLIKYPFEELRKSINKIDINSLRTNEQRKQFVLILKPYILNSTSWNEALKKYIDACFKKNKISRQ